MRWLLIALSPLPWPLAGLAADEPAGKDIDGDPLPPGAIARLGTTRFRVPAEHSGSILFAPDSKKLLVRQGGRLFFMDVATGKIVRQMKDTFGPMAFSPDGKLLVAAEPGGLRLFDWPGGKEVGKVPLDAKANPTSLAFTGPRTVVAADTMLRECDLKEKRVLLQKPFPAVEGEVRRRLLLPAGHLVALIEAGASPAISTWEWRTGERRSLARPRKFAFHDVSFSPNGALLVASHRGTEPLRVWDLARGRLLHKLPSQGRSYVHAMAFSPDSKTLATASYWAREVVLWDMKSGKRKPGLKGLAQAFGVSLTFSSDAKFLAAATDQGVIQIWDLQTGKLRQQDLGHVAELTKIAFCPRGKLIATASHDDTARLWHPHTGKQLHILRHDDHWVSDVAFSPDGSRVATTGHDDTVRLWDTASGRQLLKCVGHTWSGGDERRVSFSRDGRRLYSWGGDLFLRTFDVKTGKALAEHRTFPRGFEATDEDNDDPLPFESASKRFGQAHAAFAPGGTLALAQLNELRLLESQSHKEIGRLPRQQVHGLLAFSPNEKFLALASERAVPAHVTIWSVATRRKVQTHELPSAAADLAWSPDSRSLALVVGRKVQIWELASGKVRLTIDNLSAGARCVAFSPDGRLLVVGLRDSSALVYDLSRLVK